MKNGRVIELLFFSSICFSTISMNDRLVLIGNTNSTEKFYDFPSKIQNLTIDGPFDGRLQFSSSGSSIRIVTDENLHRFIKVEFHLGDLKIYLLPKVDLQFIELSLDLTINRDISLINLRGLSYLKSRTNLISADRLTLNCQDTSGFNLCVDVNQLTIIYRSTDDSVVRGKVRLQTEINYNGIGNLDAFQLLSRSIKLDANGLGTVMVTGIEQCFIEARALAVVQQRCFKERKFTRKDLAKIINRP